jgi:hypothetical protein
VTTIDLDGKYLIAHAAWLLKTEIEGAKLKNFTRKEY